MVEHKAVERSTGLCHRHLGRTDFGHKDYWDR
jgi:hypothetical protein